MKKMFVLGIVVLSISLCLTACGLTGGTLKLVNDTTETVFFNIYFDGTYVTVNDGATVIRPSQTISASSTTDTSYVVYGFWTSEVLWTGQLSGGETITKKFSTLKQ